LISIQVNGEARQVPEELTLASLLDWLRVPADRVAVEHNLEIVPRDRWSETTIREGDRLEVVHFVGGGVGIFPTLPCLTMSHPKPRI
jgi:thiamine biosynthesis protein ThiS